MNKTFEELAKEHLDFTTNTFPMGSARGALLHLKREIDEIIDDIDNHAPLPKLAEEFSDAYGCLIDACNRACGMPLPKVAFDAKLQINKAREWKYNGDGSYSHIKPPTTK